MRRVRSVLWILTSALCLSAGSGWSACSIQSPPHRVTVLELYTSEGCNSCPPADRWISTLPRQGLDTDKVVPLAFHVDYWNQLGWADRFSNAAFSARQRSIANRNRSDVTYTPQFVLDGKDWRFRGADLDGQLATINGQPARATIEARLRVAQPMLHLTGRVAIPEQTDHTQGGVFIALFENALSSRVDAGENRGRTLNHDFVVRDLVGPLRPSTDGAVQLDHTFPLARGWNLDQVGVAVFAQHTRTGEILQAAARMACR